MGMYEEGNYPNELVQAERRYKMEMAMAHDEYTEKVREAWAKYEPILNQFKAKMPIERTVYTNKWGFIPLNTPQEMSLFDD